MVASLQKTMLQDAALDNANKALHLADAQQNLIEGRRQVMHHINRTLGTPVVEESDMNLYMGDVTHQAQPATQPSLLSKIAPYAVAAGLAATGVGAPIAAAIMMAGPAKEIVQQLPPIIKSTISNVDVDMILEPLEK